MSTLKFNSCKNFDCIQTLLSLEAGSAHIIIEHMHTPPSYCEGTLCKLSFASIKADSMLKLIKLDLQAHKDLQAKLACCNICESQMSACKGKIFQLNLLLIMGNSSFNYQALPQ